MTLSNWTAFTMAAAAVLLVMPAAAAKQQNWPQSYYDGGHSGFNRKETELSVRTVSKMQMKWGLPGNYQVTAAALDGATVYIQDHNGDTNIWEVRALNAQTGRNKWTVNLDTSTSLVPTMAAADGLVFYIM